MKTLDSYFVTEITPDELFLVNGGGAREVGQSIGESIRWCVDEAEKSLEETWAQLKKNFLG
ncbi:hypothetical protein FACS189428_3120 [Clostridia bacterium]|nr:hypothetical protein FACS189428_3120 [Clostridia bacterium]